MRILTLLPLLAMFLLPCPALACSICGGMERRLSLAHQFEQANVVVYGYLANPKLDIKSGSGTTEFHFDKIVKDNAKFPRVKMILLSRYLPVIDPKDPPRFAMFFKIDAKTREPYTGQQISNPAVLQFVSQLLTYRDNPPESLKFAARHLDDADPQVAEEAFLVFARADDKTVGEVAKGLSSPMLRKLVKTPDLQPERLSLFAYLLGACGKAEDVELLRSFLKNPTPRYFRAYEGILAGYITMQPKEGWAFAHETLKSDKNDFVLRYAVLKTMRFYYNASPETYAVPVMQGEGLAIGHSDIADVAIRDLMQWKRWDHTKAILACYDKPSHKSEITKYDIVRYALACPLPEARTFVGQVRKANPKLIRYLEEELK